MKIAIAGASGYVGRRLGARLVAQGHEVLGLSRSASSLPSGMTAVPVDVGDTDALASALTGCERAHAAHQRAHGARSTKP